MCLYFQSDSEGALGLSRRVRYSHPVVISRYVPGWCPDDVLFVVYAVRESPDVRCGLTAKVPVGKPVEVWEHLKHTVSPFSSSPLLCVGLEYSETARRSVYLSMISLVDWFTVSPCGSCAALMPET